MCGFRLRRSFALTRRCVLPLHRIVNCAPARRCVWPDIGRQWRGCARGSGGGAMRFYCVVRGMTSYAAFRAPFDICTSFSRFIRVFCVRFTACLAFLLECFAFDHACLTFLLNVLPSITPAVCRTAPNRTACDMFRSYSARVGIAIRAFSRRCAVIGLCGFTSGLCVSLWRSRRSTRERGDTENGVNGEM